MFSLDLNKDPKKIRIVVAMSGGVDSSVVAAILKEKGYDVIGITLQLYDHGKAIDKKGACCAGADIIDAKKVAHKFKFKHYVLNYEDLFRQSVIDDFADSYLRGETPIPCVRCNQSVKFRDLMQAAKDLDADILATGHYIRRKVTNKIVQMHTAIDKNKDQSYFLFATTKEQLNFLRFPLGDFTKEKTRSEAKRLNLPVANKADSQDICFVPNGDYASVIAKIRPKAFKPGPITDIKGNILGQHDGIINYTIGQRKGLGISHNHPLFVVKIDAINNKIIVGKEHHLEGTKFIIEDLNWLGDEKILNQKHTIEANVKLRSSHKSEPALISFIDNNKAQVTTKNPTRAITPGQACVIYDKTLVLGGGWIRKIQS